MAALAFIGQGVHGDTITDKLTALEPGAVQLLSVPVEHWRFHLPDVAGGEQVSFDDHTWTEVVPGYSWPVENTKTWFRATVTIPTMIAGQSTEGLPVRLDVGMDDDGELYVDGRLKEAFHWDEGHYTLTEHAQAGQTFHLAVRGINGPGNGQLHFARLYFNALPVLERYLDAAKYVELLAARVGGNERQALESALHASEGEILFTEIAATNLAEVRTQLTGALGALAPVAAYTRKYDVYYVGHAHIDMNWLWPWTETIDVCHRTWNSAMNLMEEFPQFRFMQSQPGAYVPIEAQFPDEFARMQSMVARGQWQPAGGLWNESDTDIPGGEGLAESIMLGQRYFKAKFGRYAVTGWLPDSFGHTWQLPQIMRQAGIRYFYHTRCGNVQGITLWEAPDGSRVLKVNTDNYDEDVQLEQLAVPAVNEKRLNLPQSLVVFGVGDHGGGPTREHILRIQSFQDNPILPQVHLAGADDYFAQLERRPAAAALPVVDTDLQYTFEGCYTSHGDIKKALRSHENNLYSAQVLASLAAWLGRPYPVKEFGEAWKPVTFAQFHDIACGTAMHATYDWMHEQLVPALRTETNQIEQCLDFLTSQADTRGPGSRPIVVWNTLAFGRDDVVRAPVDYAGQYHSVVDQAGRRYPAQAASGSELVFVARNVPAFGHLVYFPQTNACSSDGITLRVTGEAYAVDTPSLSFDVSKADGAMTRFVSKPAAWNVFGGAVDGNAFELLGDTGSAWDINYTGTQRTLADEGFSLQLLDDGPVFSRLRVTHVLGHSTYSQDIVAYGALPRIDVPTTVDWQEEHTLLKVRFPLNATNLDAQAEIPFGSIHRPVNGQECPGQRWMDVSEVAQAVVQTATPLDLSAWFNARATENFDGAGFAYAADLLPVAAHYRLGLAQVPFDLPGSSSNRMDNVASAGQWLPLPASAQGDTLYLLAVCVNRGRSADLGFQMMDGSVQTRIFPISDWVVRDAPDNEAGFTFADRQAAAGKQSGVATHLWVIPVPMPKGATGLILPHDGEVHIFAATVAQRPVQSAQYGLSVLNDCKYGFDVTNHVFRLTALRSASDPDPHPDQGPQNFTYSLYPHAGGWREARSDQKALALNVPLFARVTTPHVAAGKLPMLAVENVGGTGHLVVSALKHSEDGNGYIVRFYETDGADTRARIQFGQTIRVAETDLLEQTVTNRVLVAHRKSVTLPVGHNQIISLRLEPE